MPAHAVPIDVKEKGVMWLQPPYSCSGLHLKSARPAFIPYFQPTLAATSTGPKPTIPANEPVFIRTDLHFIFPDLH